MDTLHHPTHHPALPPAAIAMLGGLAVVGVIGLVGNDLFRWTAAPPPITQPTLEPLSALRGGEPVALVDSTTHRVAALSIAMPNLKLPAGIPAYRISEKPLQAGSGTAVEDVAVGGDNAAGLNSDKVACPACGQITAIHPIYAETADGEDAAPDAHVGELIGYEVGVRYDDGRSEVLRVEDVGDWRVGDRLRMPDEPAVAPAAE